MVDEIEDAIRENAAGPESVAVDGLVVKQHPLRDQIEADRHLASKAAAKRGFRLLFIPIELPPTA